MDTETDIMRPVALNENEEQLVARILLKLTCRRGYKTVTPFP